ncbi:MAG: hypothetical protein IPK62_01335 [Bacteroidetes bacterium]|nr:hypothetical protein [Bacteroidota bacterium]MBK8143717.1 hypothetical protein [Bacteroidota bacterium]MBP6315605.1 hypothetical protein [Chitinophagaceae bacterium]
MKGFFLILAIGLIFCSNTHAQNNKTSIDSLRAANKARTDSVKAVNQAKRDSIAAIRNAREEARKASGKKKKNKTEEIEIFYPEDPKDSLALAREEKRDSLKVIREQELEKKKREMAEQKANIVATRKKIVAPLTQELSVGFRLCSDGWAFFGQRGFIKNDGDRVHTSFIWLDIAEKRNPKESRTLNENFSVVNPNELKPLSYKYGKINNFYQLKFGYGNSKPISGRLDKKSVVINWTYAIGLSLGVLKPYYLDLLVPEGNVFVRKFDKYSEENKIYFLDLNNQGTIVGGSSFTKGFNEIKIQPGLALRSGFYFDYSATRKSFLGVEIGASAEFYTKQIPIMINTKNTAYFFNIYADFRFGKRWE